MEKRKWLARNLLVSRGAGLSRESCLRDKGPLASVLSFDLCCFTSDRSADISGSVHFSA